MRIAELSRTSDVPVPSIKYYLRAGLLPAGERTAPNQADYTQRHVHRLRLIRALIEIGGLSVAGVKEVINSLDARGDNLNSALDTAISSTMPGASDSHSSPGEGEDAARQTVEELVSARGWLIDLDSPKVDVLVKALAMLNRLGPSYVGELTALYADLAEEMASQEIAWVASREDTDSAVEAAVVGTFIGAAVFNAMRMIAHENVSRRTLDRRSHTEEARGRA